MVKSALWYLFLALITLKLFLLLVLLLTLILESDCVKKSLLLLMDMSYTHCVSNLKKFKQ